MDNFSSGIIDAADEEGCAGVGLVFELTSEQFSVTVAFSEGNPIKGNPFAARRPLNHEKHERHEKKRDERVVLGKGGNGFLTLLSPVRYLLFQLCDFIKLCSCFFVPFVVHQNQRASRVIVALGYAPKLTSRPSFKPVAFK
jgi:hypothetical protein